VEFSADGENWFLDSKENNLPIAESDIGSPSCIDIRPIIRNIGMSMNARFEIIIPCGYYLMRLQAKAIPEISLPTESGSVDGATLSVVVLNGFKGWQ